MLYRHLTACLIVLCLLADGAFAAEAAQTTGPAKGTLILVGGGGGNATAAKSIYGRFVALAGGKDARIVVVSTAASSSPSYDYFNDRFARMLKQRYGAGRVTIVHTHDRKEADTEAFVKPINEATAVWFGGGRQWRFTKAYRGTLAEKAFHAVLERGGVIGGSSAGATIQGSFLARGDSRTNRIMVGDHQHGFSFLKNAAIDQHIVPRKRQLDMLDVLNDPQKKMRKEFDREALLGLGIDEDTAIVVRGDRFEVIGKPLGLVFVYDPRSWRDDTPDNKKYITLKHGAKYDLRQRKPIETVASKADTPKSGDAVATVPEEPEAEQEDPDELPAGHSAHGEVFNEGPRQRAYLMGGTGAVSFAVSSKHPKVQPFIEQGIGQLHGFWYFEAERSFRQAAVFDPDCAIAYWGMALANSKNSTRAKGFIEEAIKRRDKASQRERMYIDALADYLKGGGKKSDKAKKYIAAIEKIAKQFPDDLEAEALVAYLYYSKRKDAGKSYEDVEKQLDKVLAREPAHPVHHFRIHLWDRKTPSKALASSALCGQAAPAIAHMWHMPGHIYSRLKRYEDAAWQQEASARVDHAHMMRDRVMPDQIHNFAHNNEWLIRNLQHVGRWRDAADLAKNMTDLPRHPKYNTLNGKRGSAHYGRLRLFNVLSEYEMWDDLIAAAQGPRLEPTTVETEQIKRLHWLGVAFAATGELDRARGVLDDLNGRLTKLRPKSEPKADAKPKGKAKPSATETAINKAVPAIEARIAMHEQRFADALPLLRKAGENKMTIALVQARAGETAEAIKAGEAHVKSNENEVVPLAQFVELLFLAGEKERATETFEQLRKLSGSIQLGSPVFDRLTPIAKALDLPEDWRVKREPSNDVGERPSLDALGPFRWRPMPAADWRLLDGFGKAVSLKQYRGRPVVVVFYLGHGCLHCVDQIKALSPMTSKFKAAGIEVVAISTDPPKDLTDSIKDFDTLVPFPLVSNSGLDVFKAYRAYDDFESAPLHGTFLIDGEGLVRWADISYEPFMDIAFLLSESKRLLAQPSPAKAVK